MGDFTSSFWSIFIAVVTIASLIGTGWLALANMAKSTSAGETTGHVWDEDLIEYDNPLPRWWLYMFFITLAFGTVYVVLYPGLGSFQGAFNWSQISQYEQEMADSQERYGDLFDRYAQADVKELAKDEVAMKSAGRLFSQTCALCHGSDARGAPGIPNLVDNDWIYGDAPGKILATIQNGRTGIMPGWEPVLGGPEGVRDVVEYVLTLSGQSGDSERVARGEAQYRTVCVACHNLDGSGNQALGGMNLTDDIWVHGNSVEQLTKVIGQGVQNQMPAHLELLGEAKTRLLAAYVVKLSGN